MSVEGGVPEKGVPNAALYLDRPILRSWHFYARFEFPLKSNQCAQFGHEIVAIWWIYRRGSSPVNNPHKVSMILVIGHRMGRLSLHFTFLWLQVMQPLDLPGAPA